MKIGKIGMRAGVATVAALLMASVGVPAAQAQAVAEGDVYVFAPGDGNNLVIGDANTVAGRDNAVGSGHTTGSGHTVSDDDTGLGEEAGGPTPPIPYGTVIAHTGVNTHTQPTSNSAITGTLRDEERVALDCKVRGQNVDGNDIWYRLRFRTGWVTARYVVNTGTVPFCAAETGVAPTGAER